MKEKTINWRKDREEALTNIELTVGSQVSEKELDKMVENDKKWVEMKS